MEIPRFPEGTVVFYKPFGSTDVPRLATVVAYKPGYTVNQYLIRMEDDTEALCHAEEMMAFRDI